ncbi:MAG: tetratricopeptide repeat protein, partial [Bacteriovorax sp.]
EDRKAGRLIYQVREFLQATLFRDFRVVGRELDLVIGSQKIKATVLDLPYYRAISRRDIALELFHHGADIFQAGNLEGAMDAMKRALVFDPALADAYESLGVMLGRAEKYEEAIHWMDKLLAVNPQSVMAHTNKSLFLMKLGKTEEAETEKSLATVKSFAMFGEEAKLKKQLAEEQKKKEEDILRREKMFLQVLEIDEEDTIALYGMADIFFQRKDHVEAIKNLEKVISVDPKYSTAYLLLGKAYEALSNIDRARAIYQEGIVVASKSGDMMPANEMQSRLNQLVVSSGLS